MLYSIGIISLALVLPGQGTPSFGSVTIGYGILNEGNSVDLFCKVVNLTDDYSNSWYRESITGAKKVIYRDGMLINNDLGREAEAYTLHNTYDVLIQHVRGRDLGHLLNGNNYTCEVTLKSTGEAVLVSSGLILDARYSPSSLYPICESSSVLIGSNVTISCYSELGNPYVQIQWSRNGQAIENLTAITTYSYIYLNYTFILKADDLESNFSCSNGIQICNLKTDQAFVEESSPTMLLDVETGTCQSSNIGIIVLSVIIAVLFPIVIIETAVNIHLSRKLNQYIKNANRKNITTSVPDKMPDYINVKQSTDNRSLQMETYTDLNPREAANYSSLQNSQQKEEDEGLAMKTTTPDTAPVYINVKQSTTNHMIL